VNAGVAKQIQVSQLMSASRCIDQAPDLLQSRDPRSSPLPRSNPKQKK
jgi:hypothetical protein